MKKLIVFLILANVIIAQEAEKFLIIRCDDIGMSNAVNAAALELIKTNIPFSASVMFTCPWYQEAVEILKNVSWVSIGIHLTLNAEWKNYRWGPVAGRMAVPSLVDNEGYFFPSRAALYQNDPALEDIEKELRAQIERAIKSGLKIDYLDYHMGTAVDKPEYRSIVERLAREYNLAVSRYFEEIDVNSMYSAPVDSKLDTLMNTIKTLEAGKFNLLVCHIGKDYPELASMVDLNEFGLKEMGKHRNAELKALTSEEFREALRREGVELLTYRDLINQIGLHNMMSPVNLGIKIYDGNVK